MGFEIFEVTFNELTNTWSARDRITTESEFSNDEFGNRSIAIPGIWVGLLVITFAIRRPSPRT